MSKPSLAAALAAASLALLAGAGTARAGGNLFIYTWTDYTPPDLIKKFEAETGAKVTVDTYDSNETLLAKLKSGSTGYDIVIVSSDFVPIFAREGLIQKIDAAAMPGYGNIADRWRSPAWDKGNLYSIPYVWGVTGFSVNTRYVKQPADCLALLFSPPADAKGKVGMLGSPSEVVSLAEVYLGMPPCQTDKANMKKVSDLLEKQAPFVKVYNSDGNVERQASGETWVHMSWNGDAARARALDPAIRFVFPKEGVTGWMDNVAVPTGARDPANAKLFVQFLLKPENSGALANFTHYASAITGADGFYDDAMKSSTELTVPPGEKVDFTPACPEAATRLMDRVWTRLKK